MKRKTPMKTAHEFTEHSALMDSLKRSLREIDELDVAQLNRIGLRTYEEGKWTVRTIFQHLIDWERIWCFRALIFARREGTIPVGHDQEVMGANSNADDLTVEHLVNELRAVRQSTVLLFESFSPRMLDIRCVFSDYDMPLSGIGRAIVSHQRHHFRILHERYFPLIDRGVDG